MPRSPAADTAAAVVAGAVEGPGAAGAGAASAGASSVAAGASVSGTAEAAESDSEDALSKLGDMFGFHPIDEAEKELHKAQVVYHNVVDGETNTAPDPSVATEGQDEKAKYQAEAFKNLGVDEHTFATMDPIQRNALINAAYAKMYKSDPDTFKWAGMAAMASNKAGTGMMETQMLSAGAVDPDGKALEGAVGAPDGDKVRALLAAGNAGIFNDMYWQHLAFQNGGMDEMQKAFKEGSITQEQLDGWQKIAAGKEALDKAKASGDPRTRSRRRRRTCGAATRPCSMASRASCKMWRTARARSRARRSSSCPAR